MCLLFLQKLSTGFSICALNFCREAMFQTAEFSLSIFRSWRRYVSPILEMGPVSRYDEVLSGGSRLKCVVH
jgi:hypothetical protein